jgi:long-chain acyl-CoA synthetase
MIPSVPYILFDYEAAADIVRLDDAWRAPATFAFLSRKSGVPTEWVEEKLAGLPEEYQEGHFILLTSGSTGRPKLVVGRRDRAERLAGVIHQLQENDPVRETLLALPLTYCYAFVNQWLWARRHSRQLKCTPGLAQPDHLEQALAAAEDAMICLVGAQVPMLVQYYEGSVFPGVIRVHFAGGRFPQERLGDMRRLFPRATIFNNYGCAEAMPRLTLRRAEAASTAHHIGWPLPGVEMKADPDGRLLFRSAWGAVALIDETALTRLDETDWIPTGDLGLRMDDGHWELLGREGEIFKRYGEKISLPQVLATVRAGWHGLAECYRETDRGGEAGYVLALSPHATDAEVRTILKNLSNTRPRAHWPLRVESLSVMPLLANGKVNREALPHQPLAVVHWTQWT